jgi:hypothetical protein
MAACQNPNYGTKLLFNNGELFYTDQVTESEATQLGEYLVQEGFFSGDTISIQIDKDKETYLFRMASQEGAETDSVSISLASMFTYQLSENVFAGAPVDFHFCDDKMKTKKVVPFIVTRSE